MIHLSAIDYAVLFLYFALVLGIGFFVRKKESPDQLSEYFLAGRRVTLPIFVATLVSTWYGNLLGTVELAYKQGLVAWLTQGVFWYCVYLLFAFLVVPKIRQYKFFTIPDLMQEFYGKKSAIATAFINVLMLNPALYVLSMGIIFELVFGIDRFTGILIGTCVPLIYTLKGGFKAVIYTDFVQFLFMFFGLALLIPFALMKYGGLEVLNSVPESHFSLAGSGEWSWQIILSWALIAFWTFIDSNFYQRTFSAKTDKTAQRGILIAIGFWLVFDLMMNFIGIYAFAVNPGLDPARSLPLFADSVLPPLAKGIFLTGLIATIMSTFDSLIFSSSMAVSKDIYQKLGGNEKKIVWVNKLAILGTVLAAFLIALKFKSLVSLIYIRGTIGVAAILLPMLLGLFTKKSYKDWQILVVIISGGLSVILSFIFLKTSVEPLLLGLALEGILLIFFVFHNKSSKIL